MAFHTSASVGCWTARTTRGNNERHAESLRPKATMIAVRCNRELHKGKTAVSERKMNESDILSLSGCSATGALLTKLDKACATHTCASARGPGPQQAWQSTCAALLTANRKPHVKETGQTRRLASHLRSGPSDIQTISSSVHGVASRKNLHLMSMKQT